MYEESDGKVIILEPRIASVIQFTTIQSQTNRGEIALFSATQGLSSVPINFAVKYTAYMDPWRARRALGVNEGRSCDRSIFPKSRGGPIRRHIKAGRIISNLYCRRIRALARSRKEDPLSLYPAFSPRTHSVFLLHCSLLHAHPFF